MFGSKSLAKSVTNMAAQVEAKGYSVDASYGEEYVKIIRREDQKVMSLIEGDAAVHFVEYATDLARDADIDIATALLAESKPYVDTYE